MKRQLQGIAILLMSILLYIAYGNVSFFDLSFEWGVLFVLVGLAGFILTLIPEKKRK